ncbi:hypothetical protein ACHAXR_001187, partial [Thalassiosira sp. AJA248-18]
MQQAAGDDGKIFILNILPIPPPSLAVILCAIHFVKRCLEVLFLHVFSGRTNCWSPILISTIYTYGAILVAYAGDGNGDSNITIPTTSITPQNIIGTVVFVIGIAGIFYHHCLLAFLCRSSPTYTQNAKAKYVPPKPKGGLFSYIAAPHYLFELIGWLGIAIVSNQMNVFFLLTSMSSYLSGWRAAQNEFNQRKFDAKDWPFERTNLIPFVY